MNNPVENQDTIEGVAIRKLSGTIGQGMNYHSRIEDPEIVFMFPGQGSQYVNMGISLYRDEPVFRSIVDRCAKILEPLLDVDLRSIIYPTTVDAEAAAMTLAEIRYTQPALFVIEYALAQLWQSWGVIPTRTIGHSIGEFVSGCVGGVFSLEDALRLVAIRSKMVWESPSGAMLSVQLPAGELATQLTGDLAIGAINSPTLCVVAGETVAVEALQAQLVAQEIGCRLLYTSHAFHSPMMDAIVTPFLEIVHQVKLLPPQIPFISSVTGDWISDLQATDPHYWATQLREPVQFAAGIQTLWQQPERILLEVGPRRTTATLARQQVQNIHQQIVISTLDDAPDREWKSLFHALRQLCLAGLPLTPNGKIDRLGLPAPDLAGLQFPPSLIPPTTPTEITLAQIWTQVLRIEQIGIDDNFFELGGHSLLATQVISRARQAFALDIPLQTLFEQPTIAGLASWLDTSLWFKSSQNNVDLAGEMEEIEI